MALPLLLGLFLTGFRPGKLIFLIYLTVLLISALILSLSRGGWIGSVLGLSFMTFATIYTQYQPPGLKSHFTMAHNDYLHFISEVGLPLMAIVVWMIIVLYRRGFKKLKNTSRLVREITLGAMTGITAILVHSISDFNLHIPSNAILFTVLAAIVAAPLPTASQP